MTTNQQEPISSSIIQSVPSQPSTHHQHHDQYSGTIYDPDADLIPVQQDDLIRLKIFIPFATLSALFANLVSAIIIKPSMGEINNRYYTLVTPDPIFIGLYWIVLFTLLVVLTFMIVFTSNQRYRTEQTKQLFVNALGFRYVLALFCFTLWPFFWAGRLMSVAAALLIIIFGLLLSIHFSLLRNFPTSALKRPFSFLFVHLPLRLFLLVLWQVDILQTVLIALGWYKIRPDGEWEAHHRAHVWIVFGLIIAIGVINSLVTLLMEDVIWTIGSIWLTAGVIRGGGGRMGKLGEEPLLAGTMIGLAALQLLCLAGTIGAKIGRVRKLRREQAIQLPVDDDPSVIEG
ncbi:uncharacterized protein MELLADRAFT_116780 [Melampsora larici-populina 98AG31]|uniref:Uncharacterized protein n=1 Tax=Melampsora larici-populina (strain 98AG31 / pathotype 3-4-7) TaxID=747676 RepID=F4RPX8_MELLP|nr:uncharacterized protein MELLADRAFT_116780 [Melampsora larici-populina 98AG31]EGG05622.1 hypothetical protein MELLADRAFT_116780 [Melampsora larici-populina 98AG31]